MDKKTYNLRNRSRHQDLFDSSDESLNDDLDAQIRQAINRKKIFSQAENDKVKLRPSIVEKNVRKFVSSTPMCYAKKGFSSSLCISPIEDDEPVSHRLRSLSNSLQQQVVSSTSEGARRRTSYNQNNTDLFIKHNSGSSCRKKETVHNNRKVFPHDNTINKTQADNSLLARALPPSLNYSENENEISMKSILLNNDEKKSGKSQIRRTFSTHAQTSFKIGPTTVTKQSRLSQTVVDKATQITDSLEKDVAVNQNNTVTNDSNEHECTLTNPVNLSNNNEIPAHSHKTNFNNMTKKSKDTSLICMCRIVNDLKGKPTPNCVHTETDHINTNKDVIEDGWLDELLSKHLKDEISDISDVTYKSDTESAQSGQKRLVVCLTKNDIQFQAKDFDKQHLEKSNTKRRKNISVEKIEENKELENERKKSASSGVIILQNELIRPKDVKENVKKKPAKKSIKNSSNLVEDKQVAEKSGTKGKRNTSKRLEETKQLKEERNKLASSGVLTHRNEFIPPEDAEQNVKQKPAKRGIKNALNTTKDSSHENSRDIDRDLPNAIDDELDSLNGSDNSTLVNNRIVTPCKTHKSYGKLNNSEKRKSKVSTERTKRKRSVLINDDEVFDGSTDETISDDWQRSLIAKENEIRHNISRNGCRQLIDQEQQMESDKNFPDICIDSSHDNGDMDRDLPNAIDELRRPENSDDLTVVNGRIVTPYKNHMSYDKVKSSEKRKSKVSTERTKRKRSVLINDDEVFDGSKDDKILDDWQRSPIAKENEIRHNISRNLFRRVIDQKQQTEIDKNVPHIHTDSSHDNGDMDRDLPNAIDELRRPENNDDLTVVNGRIVTPYKNHMSYDKVKSSEKRKSKVSTERTKRKRSVLINDDDVFDGSTDERISDDWQRSLIAKENEIRHNISRNGCRQLIDQEQQMESDKNFPDIPIEMVNSPTKDQSSKLNNVLFETVDKVDNSRHVRSHSRNTSNVSVKKRKGKLDAKENENEEYTDLNTDALSNCQNASTLLQSTIAKNNYGNKKNQSNSMNIEKKNKKTKENLKKNQKTKESSIKNQKTKESSKKNQKTKQRQPLEDIEAALDIVEDDSQSRGEIGGLRRSKRIRKERVVHYCQPILFTWDKRLVEDTKQDTMLYSSCLSECTKYKESFQKKKLTKKLSPKEVSKEIAGDKKNTTLQVNNGYPKSGNVITTSNTSQVNNELSKSRNIVRTSKRSQVNDSQFFDISSNSRNVNGDVENNIINNDLIKDIVNNISNSEQFNNKNVPNDISENLKGNTSTYIERNYFYFPQNNGVHKFDWCIPFPNLDKLDENSCLRMGTGTKSFQSGYQNGYLEIPPAESKPRDMLKRFSLVFVVLSGVGEFEVHDSYQTVQHCSIISVPLGAYYCIRNTSHSEKLLLFYIKIKSPKND